MHKLFFIVAVTSAFLLAKPCMTDIYTGNGINTSDKEAWINMKALRSFMLKDASASSRLDTSKYNIDYSFKYIHNPDHGFNNDILETYYQLKETGQISDGFFHTMFSFFAGNIPETALHSKIMEIIGTYEADVNDIYWKYYNKSFSKKHNVLLVAHSQGNLIGNKVYTLLSEDEKTKFRMVSVATPVNYVKIKGQTSPYVTAHADLVINNPFIPNHLPTNVAGTGHNFIATYLDAHSNARHMIASYVKSAYDDLRKTTNCSEYWALTMDLYTEGYIKVFAYLIRNGHNTQVASLIGIVDLNTYPLVVEVDNNGNIIKKCNVAPNAVTFWGHSDLCYDGYDGKCGWKAGNLFSKKTLESHKNLSFIMASEDNKNCINISHSGELYELTKDIF